MSSFLCAIHMRSLYLSLLGRLSALSLYAWLIMCSVFLSLKMHLHVRLGDVLESYLLRNTVQNQRIVLDMYPYWIQEANRSIGAFIYACITTFIDPCCSFAHNQGFLKVTGWYSICICLIELVTNLFR